MNRILLLAASSFVSIALAQMPFSLQTRESARFLELSAAQIAQLAQIDSDRAAFMSERVAQAKQIEAALDEEAKRARPGASGLGRRQGELEAICQQSRERDAKAMQQARAVLTAPQLTKLATLEQAFVLMPVIQSAQRAHLLSSTLVDAPTGMPEGTVEVEFAYQRSEPVALPGCRTRYQRVHRGTDLVPPAKQPRNPVR